MTRLYENPPAEISHSSGRKLKLTESDDVVFRCDGCKEPGYGRRYTCDGGGDSYDLHTCCAVTEDTLKHPLFGDLTFEFLTEPPPPVDRRTICDACGEAARGFVYHCSKKNGLDLHPCCASLPKRILQDSRVFELRWEASRSRPCGMCGEQSRRRRRFWAFRSNLDGEAMDIHVACMKEMARLSWHAAYQNRVGGAQIVQVSVSDMDRMLQSFPGNRVRRSRLDKFVKIIGTVASIIIAVIFGNPVAMMAAIAGPGGLLRS